MTKKEFINKMIKLSDEEVKRQLSTNNEEKARLAGYASGVISRLLKKI